MKLLDSLYLFSLTLLLCNCDHLVPDPILPAIQAGYPTAEFYACGHHFHGLGICSLKKGSDLSELSLKIRGIAQGTIRVQSLDCAIDEEITYTQSQTLDLELKGKINESCLIGITVAPVYPTQHKDGIQVFAFRGYLKVRGLEDRDQWMFHTSKYAQNSVGVVHVIPYPSTPATVHINSKDSKIHYQEILNPNSLENVEIQLSRLPFSFAQTRLSSLEGIIYTQNSNQDLLFSWLISVYDAKFMPLPIPNAVVVKKKLRVAADSTVSLMELDEKGVFKQKYQFDFDPTLPHTLRLYTVSGRSVIGDYNEKTKAWEWVNDGTR